MFYDMGVQGGHQLGCLSFSCISVHNGVSVWISRINHHIRIGTGTTKGVKRSKGKEYAI
jgi:hypothetical protein